jgi:carbamoyl-phosphate synthase large subunit
MAETVNVLLTCVGRRVSLLRGFRQALADLGLRGKVIGADYSALAAGYHLADEGVLVPPVEEATYVDALLEVCRSRQVHMLVPLIDWELAVLAGAAERFRAAGVRLVLSAAPVVAICRDKRQTHDFMKGHGFDTPTILPYAHALEAEFPLFMKPRFGSSAKDVHYVADRAALEFYNRRGAETVIQEFVQGQEHTVDVYAGLDGTPRVAVPRRRIEVRGGEVSKALTVRQPEIIRRSMDLVRALGACMGVVTLQCFLQPEGGVKFIEINPRFGGGVPLAIRAGANFPRWLVEEHLGRKPHIDPEAWQGGLAMLRYDEAVFVKAVDAGLPG